MHTSTKLEQRLFEFAIAVVVICACNIIAGESNLLTNSYCNRIDPERFFCVHRALPRQLAGAATFTTLVATFSWRYPRVRAFSALAAAACALVLSYLFYPAAGIHVIRMGH